MATQKKTTSKTTVRKRSTTKPVTTSAKQRQVLNAFLANKGIPLVRPDVSVRPDAGFVPKINKLPKINLPKVDLQVEAPNVGQTELASYMLAPNKLKSKALGAGVAADEEKVSLMSKIFDTLSIPLYTAVGIEGALAEGVTEGESFGKNLGDVLGGVGKSLLGGGLRAVDALDLGIPEALTGGTGGAVDKWYTTAEDQLLPRETHADLLKEHTNLDKFGRNLGGFALDLALDPLNLVGVGALKLGKRGIESAGDVLDAKAAGEVAQKADEVGPRTAHPFTGESRKFTPSGLAGQATSPSRGPQGLLNTPRVSVAGATGARGLSSHQPMPLSLGNNANIADKLTPHLDAFGKGGAKKLEELRIAKEHGQQKILAEAEAPSMPMPNPAKKTQELLAERQTHWTQAGIQAGKELKVGKGNVVNEAAANQVARNMVDGLTPKNVIHINPPSPANHVVAKEIADDMVDAHMGQVFNPGTKRWHTAKGMVKRGLPTDITPGQQVAMFNQILKAVGNQGPGEAVRTLAAAENHLISLGVQPAWANGSRVRLSEVIVAVGHNAPPSVVLRDFMKSDMSKMDPMVRAAITNLTAQRAVNITEVVGEISHMAAKATRDAKLLNGAAKVVQEKRIVQAAVDEATHMGLSSAEVQHVKGLVQDIVDIEKLPVDKWVTATRVALVEAAEQGKASPELIESFNKAVEQSVGISYKELGTRVSVNKAVETIMTHFTTWWGKGDLKNYQRDVFDAVYQNAGIRAKTLREMGRKYSPAENISAWKMAAGLEVNPDPRVLELSNKYKDWMTRLYGTIEKGDRKTNPAIADLSVAQKSMTAMEDVNRHLKNMGSTFRFKTGRFTDDLGNHHYFEGADWMNSWVDFKPQDPVKFMYDMDLALQKTTSEYAFMDDFVGRFGSRTKTAQHSVDISSINPRLKGFYTDPEVASQLRKVLTDMNTVDWTPTNKALRFYAKGLRVWKAGVTKYIPSHHIRNGIGDSYLMWMAGYNDPRAFITGKRIMASQRTRYKNAVKTGDFNTLDELTDPQMIKWAATDAQDVVINVNGKKLTADQVYLAAHQRGLLLDANQAEDLFATPPLGEISVSSSGAKRLLQAPTGGRASKIAGNATEYREHLIRLSHYNAAVKKFLKQGKGLKTALDDAAAEVRKWHPDGRDLTHLEQHIRMVIPFYSWIRKSSPLLIQSLVQRPAKAMVYPKMMESIQGMMGTQGDEPYVDPFPDAQLFPEWIRGYGIGPIGDPESDNSVARWFGNLGTTMTNLKGDPYGYTVVNPSNPLIDMVQQFGGFGPKDTLQGGLDALTPALKVPYELGTGRDFTGAPIYKDEGGPGVATYMGKQIPFTAPLQRFSNIGDKKREGKEKGWDKEAFINFMTALGVRGTGPHIKSAEYEALAHERAKKNG